MLGQLVTVACSILLQVWACSEDAAAGLNSRTGQSSMHDQNPAKWFVAACAPAGCRFKGVSQILCAPAGCRRTSARSARCSRASCCRRAAARCATVWRSPAAPSAAPSSAGCSGVRPQALPRDFHGSQECHASLLPLPGGGRHVTIAPGAKTEVLPSGLTN